MYDVSICCQKTNTIVVKNKYFSSFKKSDDYKTGQGLLFMEGNVAGSTLKTCNYMEGASSVTKDPESLFEPIGLRKGCFKFGQHVIYNNGELCRVKIPASCLDMVQTLTI